jgi:hypothetical protein
MPPHPDVTILDVLENAEHNIGVAERNPGDRMTVRRALLFAAGQVHTVRALLERGYPVNTVVDEEMFSEFDEEPPPPTNDGQMSLMGPDAAEEDEE